MRLEVKFEVLRNFDVGEKAVEIIRVLGLPTTTVRTILVLGRLLKGVCVCVCVMCDVW